MKTIVFIVVLFAFVLSQNGPILPTQYEIEFNQSTKIGIIKGQTKGKIYYDYINQLELVTRENGLHDRYCGTVEKLASTPCNHYVVNGNRYLDFPAKKYCCYCCNSTSGCGILKPDWLSGATYLGLEKIDTNEFFEKWDMKGLQDNFYYNTHDEKQIPRRLDQNPDDLMDFIMSSYYIGIRDPSVFDLPSYCTAKCGSTTICATIRGDNNNMLRSQ